jgi:adenosylcobinamide hydrolase
MSSKFLKDGFMRKFDAEMRSLACAPHRGGYSLARGFFFMQVDRNYSGNYKEDCKEFERKNRMEGFVGFMTAAPIHEVLSHCKLNPVEVWVTAGIEQNSHSNSEFNPVTTEFSPGTINLAIIVDGGLTLNGMVNAITTAIEVKTKVMLEKYRMTGTASDCIGIFLLGRRG